MLFIGLSFLISKICLRKKFDERLFFRATFSSIMFFFLIWVLYDESRTKSNYSWEDLAVPIKNADKSYQLAYVTIGSDKTNARVSSPAFDIKAAINNPVKFEKEIIELWNNIVSIREVVDELHTFEQIADLSTVENVASTYNLMNILYIARIYGSYAALMTEKDDPEEGAEQIIKLHSVIRKSLPFARFLINKAIWTAVTKQNIKNAKKIATSPNTKITTLKKLELSFKPLTSKEISYKVAFISEFFYYESQNKDDLDFDKFFEGLCQSFHFSENVCKSTWHKNFLRIITPYIVQNKATINSEMKIFEYLIEGSDRQPPQYEEIKVHTSQFYKKFGLRNIGGWIFCISNIADLREYTKAISEIKVRSDLLSIYLKERIGLVHDTKDYFTKSEYFKTKVPYIYKSSGPDGVLNTKDDIHF